MSADGRLPDGVNDWDLPGSRPCDRECPDSCASNMTIPVYEKCGGIGACGCFLHKYLGFAACELEPDPECDCPTEAEIRADRAQARAEAREDR